ncbi:uncharacterized protein C8Q71DRAFT_909446 [Rhodofomes roseus]|uniref:F-box domain-containing protein n=1 Tax=Rhodofomes roseus TaxID=34475 RepID=A0ABQ8K7W0_9APHY|nr:uncharacterized protein C8Q71DRAFT_909446 [Rhodofomes roseus]KAH9833393.1 hypothetical protein C8Q71DRAFT_909446 [Rhodofomes roseus]
MFARHALSIPEILLHVFGHLQPDTENWEKRERGNPESRAAALARSARVCKDFREPALRVLWRDIPSIDVLVKLLSPSAKEVPVWVLVRSIRAEEWTRFQYHARFVRCCRMPAHEFSGVYRHPVGTTVHHHLSIENTGKPLLPNLEELEWSQDQPLVTSLFFLLTPSLRRLTIYMREDPYARRYEQSFDQAIHAEQMLLNRVFTLSPRLGYLCLQGTWNRTDVFPEIPRIDSPSPAYRSLDFSHFGSLGMMVNKLADVPYLTFLSVTAVKLPPLEERPTFKHLRQLVVKEESPGSSATFLASAAFPKLRSLRLHMPDARIPDALWQATAIALPHLRKLYVRRARSRHSPQPMDCSVADALRPLLALVDLRRVEIDFGAWALDASDDDVREITRSWPKLQVLKLSHHASSVRLSLHALACVERNCPDLTAPALSGIFIHNILVRGVHTQYIDRAK